MNITIYIEQITVPDIAHTIANGGKFNFLFLINIYDISPTANIPRTVGMLQEAIGLCTSISNPPSLSPSV